MAYKDNCLKNVIFRVDFAEDFPTVILPITKMKVSILMTKVDKCPKIYTAFSKHNFYARYQISAYVLNQNLIPLNPFTNWEYFMCDMVNRDLIKRANNNLIEIANELWVFGQIADGVYFEIELAKQLGLKIKFFSLGKNLSDIQDNVQ